jgi:hypothetical protein
LFPRVALAQADVTTPPKNIVLPNYNGVPVGPFGGLEASAYVARASDPSAAWFNPAGLSRSPGAQITGSAGLYQLTTVSATSLPNNGGSVQHVPNLVGFTVRANKLTFGVALLTTIAWSQETDAELLQSTPANSPERFAYSADADLERRVGVASFGYDNGKAWRIGAGLAASYVSLRMTQSVSDRVAEPTMLRTLLLSSRTSGSALQFRPVVGIQAELKKNIRVGGVLRTPSFSMFPGASATLDGTTNSGAMSSGASFFDPSADFKFKEPWEVSGGIAFIGSRADIEVDVLGYSSISGYSMVSSSQNVVVYQDAGHGDAPTVQRLPFEGLNTAARAMANVSVGGHYQFSRARPLLLHYGVATDLSPVKPDDQVFDKINMATWTVGLSGTTGKFSYAAGINVRAGTSNSVPVRDLLSGEKLQTTVDVKTFGMIYSLAYQF